MTSISILAVWQGMLLCDGLEKAQLFVFNKLREKQSDLV